MSDKKTFQKEVLTLITNCNLQDALHLILLKGDLTTDDFFIKILLCCCSQCVHEEKNKSIKAKDLLQLVVHCSENICQLQENQWFKYLRSVFYILKFLLKHDATDDVNSLEKILLPHFWDDCVKNKHLSLYKPLCDCVHNVLSTIMKKCYNNVKVAVSKGIVWCFLALKMFKKIYSLEQLFQNNVSVYLRSFDAIPLSNRLKIYLQLLQLVESDLDKSSDKVVYVLLVKTLKQMTENVNGSENVVLLKECLNGIANCVKKRTDKEGLRVCLLLVSLSRLLGSEQDVHVKIDEFYQQFLKVRCSTEEIYYLIVNVLKCVFNRVKSDEIKLTYEFTISCIQLTFALSKEIADIDKECDQCENCVVCTDIYTSVKLLSNACSIVKMAVSKNVSMVEGEMLDLTLKLFKYGCDLIGRMIKQLCQKWKIVWTTIGTLMYNVGVNLYYDKKSEKCLQFWELFVEKSLAFEKDEEVINVLILSQALSGLTEICINSRQYEKAVSFTALNALKCSEERYRSVFMQWIRIKKFNKNPEMSDPICEKIQITTIISPLEDHEEFSKLLNPSIKTSLLSKELEYYKSFLPSKKPMKISLEKLANVADIFDCVKILVKIWGDYKTPVHDDFFRLFTEIFERFEEKIKSVKILDLETRILLINMNLLRYKFKMEELRFRTCDEMNNTVVALKPALQPHEIPPHPNDECDMVSAYSNLKVDTIQKNIRHLNEALDILKKIDLSIDDDVPLFKTYKIVDLISMIAEEYQLNNYSSFAIQSWHINLQIAELLNDNVIELKCISLILEETGVHGRDGLLKRGQKIASQLQNQNSDSESIVLFYTQKSRHYLKTNNMDKALLYYKKAEELINKNPSDKLLKIKVDLLRYQIMILPCSYNIEGHDTMPISRLHQHLYIITSYMKEKKHSPSSLKLFFELTRTVGSAYKWMFLPREVRCYCRDAVVLAQKLLLTLVSSELLVLLSHADLHSVRYDDCSVKLEGLSNILCLYPEKMHATPEPVTKAEINIIDHENDIELQHSTELFEFREQLLDVPPVNFTTNIGSPEFTRRSFKMPKFISHNSHCDCAYCSNIEYQVVTLKVLHLYALLYLHKEDFITSKQFFEGSLIFHRKLRMRATCLKNKVNKIVSEEVLFNAESMYWEPYCSILLDYGYFLMKTNHFLDAKKVNEKLLNQFTNKKLQNLYLQNEAVMQKCFIEISLADVKKTEVELKVITIDDENVAESKTPEKTPENRRTTITIKSSSPRLITPPTRIVKALKFDLTEDDEQVDVKKKEFVDRELSSFFSKFSKTPAIPKVKVYVSPPKPTTVERNNILTLPPDSSKLESSDYIIPASPNAYTPVPRKLNPKGELGLRSRTKLLTSKLKSSVKENIENIPNKASDLNKLDNNVIKTNVRKNLLSELNEIVTDMNDLNIAAPERKKDNALKKEKEIKNNPSVRKKRGRPPKKV